MIFVFSTLSRVQLRERESFFLEKTKKSVQVNTPAHMFNQESWVQGVCFVLFCFLILFSVPAAYFTWSSKGIVCVSSFVAPNFAYESTSTIFVVVFFCWFGKQQFHVSAKQYFSFSSSTKNQNS